MVTMVARLIVILAAQSFLGAAQAHDVVADCAAAQDAAKDVDDEVSLLTVSTQLARAKERQEASAETGSDEQIRDSGRNEEELFPQMYHANGWSRHAPAAISPYLPLGGLGGQGTSGPLEKEKHVGERLVFGKGKGNQRKLEEEGGDDDEESKRKKRKAEVYKKVCGEYYCQRRDLFDSSSDETLGTAEKNLSPCQAQGYKVGGKRGVKLHKDGWQPHNIYYDHAHDRCAEIYSHVGDTQHVWKCRRHPRYIKPKKHANLFCGPQADAKTGKGCKSSMHKAGAPYDDKMICGTCHCFRSNDLADPIRKEKKLLR